MPPMTSRSPPAPSSLPSDTASEVRRAPHAMSVDRGNDVADVYSGLPGRRARLDIRDHRAPQVTQPERLRQIGRQILGGDAALPRRTSLWTVN